MFSVALITQTLEVQRGQPQLYRTAQIAMLISVLASLGVGLTDWGAKGSLTSMVVLLLLPVATGLVVWLRHTDPDTLGFG